MKKSLLILFALCALQSPLIKAMEANQDPLSKDQLERLNRQLFHAIDSGYCEQVDENE